MELKSVVPWGRLLSEYIDIFMLSEEDLGKKILGCSDGPASFNAELTARGGNVISADPVYQFAGQELAARVAEAHDEIIPQVRANQDKYIWTKISSVEELARRRLKAAEIFLNDYDKGKRAGRYIPASLPNLPFKDKQFELALCSHYLFLYSKQVDFEQHILSIKELCRVAQEVRIFPLISMDGQMSVHLEPVMLELEKNGLKANISTTVFQLQKNGDKMLSIY